MIGPKARLFALILRLDQEKIREEIRFHILYAPISSV